MILDYQWDGTRSFLIITTVFIHLFERLFCILLWPHSDLESITFSFTITAEHLGEKSVESANFSTKYHRLYLLPDEMAYL